jgi:hypothetical protein
MGCTQSRPPAGTQPGCNLARSIIPLPPARRFGLRFHLLLSTWCRRSGRQLRFLRAAAHDHSEELANAAPQGLAPEARERLKQSLRNDQK